MNMLPISLAVLLLAQSPSPAELPSPPTAIPLQPAPATLVPEAPPAAPQFDSLSPAMNSPSAFRQNEELSTIKESDAGQSAPAAVPRSPKFEPSSSAVAPAAAEQEVISAALSQQLWRTAIEQADAAAFHAEPLSLLDTVRTFGGTAGQLEAVKAYWRLSASIVQFSFAEEEAAVLGQAREPQLPHERALLAAARAAALARQQELQLAVTLAQHDLAERPLGASNRLSWPTDVPLMAAYRTHFEALFAGRSAPAALLKIHKTLPLMLESLEGQAVAVAAYGEAVQQMAQAYAGGQLSLKELLETISGWREQRTAFVRGVLRYNEQIAEYALAVVFPGADPTTVVSTLIDLKQASQPARAAGEVRQTGALEPLTPETPPNASTGDRTPAEQPRTAGTAQGSSPQSQSVLSGVRVAHEPQ